jgi:rubrerythrin
MTDEMREAVETALKLEYDSIDFYRDAAQRTDSRLGKSMFESLVKDEQRHVRALQYLMKEAAPRAPVEEVFPSRGRTFKSAISTVFSEARKDIGKRIPSDADDLHALTTAMDLEKGGHRFYGEAARKARDETVRSVYLRLQQEEDEHFTFLQNTYQYMESSGDWFLWEEQGLLDGG